jgi:fatty-acid desaturase
MAKLLTTLLRMDRTSVFLGALVVALIGLFVPGWIGALILFAVVAALAALQSKTWSVTPLGHRVFRLAVLAILAAIATSKLFG